MAGTYVETAPQTEALAPAASPPSVLWRWAIRIAVLLVALWIVAEGISLGIQHTRLNRLLTAQVAASMGRPVEVGSYHFSFWDGPVIEARNVTVGEDARFGAEYFVRADSMAVRLRWQSLLRGRVEFGTVSLIRPSLNLVRSSSGEWNLAEWLPHPGSPTRPLGFTGPIPPVKVSRFRRIEIDGGRINFKLEDLKLPFAFVAVSGTVEADGPGRWLLNLQASPWRAAVVLQRVGTIHLSGDIGGTSSRLLPAALNINWSDASLPDILRLARRDDFGVRGLFSLAIEAHTIESSNSWTVQARANLQQIHRWDLPLRPDNPALNLDAQLAWQPGSPYVELNRAIIDAPHSNLHADGRVYWAKPESRAKRTIPPVQVVFSSANLDAGDLLAWIRAFHAGLADNLLARGSAEAHAAFAGWPPRIAHAELSSNELDVFGSRPATSAHIGPLHLRYDGALALAPVNVSWGAAGSHPDGSFRLEEISQPTQKAASVWRVSGYANQARDLIEGASALGWNISRGWDLGGPFACDLRWQSARGARLLDVARQPSGSMQFGGVSDPSDGVTLRAPFLNLPIEQIKARVDLKPGIRQVKLTSAQAFGARWTGTFERRVPDGLWQFNLSADRLSTAALDRWLNPRWRESFLDRVLPFLNSHSGSPAAPENLQADGHLTIDRFLVIPFALSRLQGTAAIRGRDISLTNASAQFYGGQLSGSFDTNLNVTPSYQADLDFSRVDIAALTSVSPSLAGLFAGNLNAQMFLEAQGATRTDLLSHLACRGNARVSAPKLQKLNLEGSMYDGAFEPGSSVFGAVDADFSCSNRRIQFRNLNFVSVDSAVTAEGAFDFGGNLDLSLRNQPAISEGPENGVRVTGTLSSPQFTRIQASSPRRSPR